MKIKLGKQDFQIIDGSLWIRCDEGIIYEELVDLCEILRTDTTISHISLYNTDTGPTIPKQLDACVMKNPNILSCKYVHQSMCASQFLKVRQNAFNALVRNFASNNSFNSPIAAIQFRWLRDHGYKYYHNILDSNKISYLDFKSKWKDALEKQSFGIFRKCFDSLSPKYLDELKKLSNGMLPFILDEKNKPIKLALPEDIMKHIFSFFSISDKINHIDINTEIPKV